jgi:hypothetical protein
MLTHNEVISMLELIIPYDHRMRKQHATEHIYESLHSHASARSVHTELIIVEEVIDQHQHTYKEYHLFEQRAVSETVDHPQLSVACENTYSLHC